MKLEQALGNGHPQVVLQALRAEYDRMITWVISASDPPMIYRAQGRATLLKEMIDALSKSTS